MNLQENETSATPVRQIYLLQGAQIDFYWVQIVELFNSVPEFWEYYSPEWTYEQVKTGRFQVWALSDGAIRGIVLTQLLEFPRKKVFEIMALAGLEMMEFLSELETVFTRFAQRFGATTLSAQVRPALQRKLRAFGAEAVTVVLRKDIPCAGLEQ